MERGGSMMVWVCGGFRPLDLSMEAFMADDEFMDSLSSARHEWKFLGSRIRGVELAFCNVEVISPVL